jgi:hypothetical protein
MNKTSLSAVVLTAGLSLAAHDALAAKACEIVGTYTDSLGSTIVFKTTKTGTAKNATICSSTYKLTVTKDTSKAIDADGTAKGCGNLTAKFKPNYPTCTSATGTVTVTGLGTFNDTITKKSKKVETRPMGDTSALEKGFR